MSSGWARRGWRSIWLAAGVTPVALLTASSCSIVKLETPTERTLDLGSSIMAVGELAEGKGGGLGIRSLTLPGLCERGVVVNVCLCLVAVFSGVDAGSLVKEGYGPVNEVELEDTIDVSLSGGTQFIENNGTYIEVFKLELGQSVLESRENLIGSVGSVPQLGGDEDVLTLQSWDIIKGLLDALSDFLLVAVDLGKIEVAVSRLKSFIDGLADLTRLGLPGSKAQGGNGVASVELDGFTERHDCDLGGLEAVCFLKGRGLEMMSEN